MLMPRDFPQTLTRPTTGEELERLKKYTFRIKNLRYRAGANISFQTFLNLTSLNPSYEWVSLWPKLKTLCWATLAEEQLQFMRYFLTCGVQKLAINLMNVKVWESRKALSLVEARCGQLTEFNLYAPAEANDVESQTIIRETILHNYHTLKFFCPPQGSSSAVIEAVLGLPALETLEMHNPKIGWPRVSHTSLRSLERLIFTLDKPNHIPRLLGDVRGSKLRTFGLTSPYPVREDHLKSLADLFKLTGLYDSLNRFSWQPPRGNEQSLTWEFVTILTPFVNLHTLSLGVNCDGTCRFRFKHEHIITLSEQMPQLRDLNVGGEPCAHGGSATDIGFHTFAELARRCLDLSRLSIHFNPHCIDLGNYTGPNRNVVHWDVGNTVLPEDPEMLTMIALRAQMLFPEATIAGETRTDALGWRAVREKFKQPLDLNV